MLPEPSAPDLDAPSGFYEDLGQALQGLRGALTELFATVPELPERPYPMSRFLGVNKNLAWRAVQVARTADPAEAVPHIPGASGIERLLEAFAGRGAPGREVEAVREALRVFDEMVSTHAGDRTSLELMLGSLEPERLDAASLEASRKLAFQGNSATLGVRARTHFVLNIVTPRATAPSEFDVVTIGGLVGFRRLRPDVTWPLMRMRVFAETGESRLGPLVPTDGPPLVAPFCSDPRAELRRHQEGDCLTYSVPEGPVGQTAESDWVFGLRAEAVGNVYSEDGEGVVEFQSRLATPAEVAVCDVLVHRDLPFEGAPWTKVVALMCETPSFPFWQHAKHTIPLPDRVEELGCPAVIASRHVPRYREIVDLALEQMGRQPGEFRGYRLTLSYPPIPAAPLLVYPQSKPPA